MEDDAASVMSSVGMPCTHSHVFGYVVDFFYRMGDTRGGHVHRYKTAERKAVRLKAKIGAGVLQEGCRRKEQVFLEPM
jgi:hypothetical protein